VLKDEEGYQMVINRQQAEQTQAAILNRYRVPRANACRVADQALGRP
jgi:hypothetical protein